MEVGVIVLKYFITRVIKKELSKNLVRIKKELSKIFAIISIWNTIVTIKCVYIYIHISMNLLWDLNSSYIKFLLV